MNNCGLFFHFDVLYYKNVERRCIPIANKLGLTETQYMIMAYFWKENRELTVNMVQTHFSVSGYHWAVQTVQTFLEQLVKKGALSIKRQGHQKKYYPSMDRLAYAAYWMKHMISQNFDNGLDDFAVALSCFRDGLSDEQKKELEKIWYE